MKTAALTLIVVLSVMGSISLVTGSFAQDNKPMSYSGQVVNVDSRAKSITVKGSNGEMTFNVAGAQWAGYKSAEDLKTGDSVTVAYVKNDGSMNAVSVKAPLGRRVTDELKSIGKKTKPEDKPAEK